MHYDRFARVSSSATLIPSCESERYGSLDPNTPTRGLACRKPSSSVFQDTDSVVQVGSDHWYPAFSSRTTDRTSTP